MASPKVINNAEEATRALTSGEQGKFREIDPTDRASLDALFKKAETKNPTLRFDTSAIQQELLEDKAKHQEQQSSQQNEPTTTGLGQLGTAVGGGILAGITANRSHTQEIIDDLKAERTEFKKEALFDDIENALTAKDDAKALQLLNTLQQDTLLASQVDQLQVRAHDVAKNEKEQKQTRETIEKKYTTLKAGQKGSREFDANTFLTTIKVASPEERRKLLEGLFAEQHDKSSNDLYQILSKKHFWDKRPLSRSVRKGLVEMGKKEKKLREEAWDREKKEEEQHEKDQPLQNTSINYRSFSEAPSQPELMPTPMGNEGVESGGAEPSRPHLPKSIVSGGGRLATKAIASNPELWPWIALGIGILVLIVILIVIIMMLLNSNATPPNLDAYATAIPCGEGYDQYHELKSIVNARFNVNFSDYNGSAADSGASGSKASDNPRSAVNVVFQTLCLLYGRTPDKYNNNNKYINDFGNAFIGPDQLSHNDNKTTLIDLVPGQSSQNPPCNISGLETRNNGVAKIVINNPAASTDPQNPTTGPYCSSWQLRYVLSRDAAKTLYERVKKGYFGDSRSTIKSILDNWQKLFHNLSSKNNFLPTSACSTNKDEESCFADMVGEYLTFPFYFDSPSTPPDPNASDTTLVQSPLSDYPSGNYQDYYNFAKTYLFNGQEFFTLSGGPASNGQPVAYATQLTKDIQTACAGPNNTGNIYGHYYVKVTSANAQKCLGSLRPTYGNSVIDQMIASATDPHNGYKLQCIGFAQGISIGIDGTDKAITSCLIQLPGWSGDKSVLPQQTRAQGYNVTCQAKAAYTFIAKPPQDPHHQHFMLLPGDFALYNFTTWGHIAYVLSAHYSTSRGTTASYVVSETNGSDGSVDISSTYQVDNNLIGVLRHK